MREALHEWRKKNGVVFLTLTLGLFYLFIPIAQGSQNTNPVIEYWGAWTDKDGDGEADDWEPGLWKLTLEPSIAPENLTIESPNKLTLPAPLPGDPPSEAVMIPWTDDPSGMDVTVTLNYKIEPGIRTQTDQNHAKPDKVEPYFAEIDTIDWEITDVASDTTGGTGEVANFRITAQSLGKLIYTVKIKGKDGMAPIWPQTGQEDQATFTKEVLLVPADIAVDSNRDGTIRFAGNFQTTQGKPTDTTTEAKPFRFWCNDDNDGLPNSEGEAVCTGTPDYDDGVIQTARDLEDFARLYVHVGGFYEEIANGTFKIGLKWRDTNGTAPKIKVYKSTDTAGSDEYLKSDTAAIAQVSGEDAETLGEVSGATPLILPAELFAGYSEANPKVCLLFEGSGEGKGQLCITIHKADGTPLGEGAGVWLDLVDVRKMYQSSVDDVFEEPSDEAKESIVFVHGWNMSPNGSRNFAETMFKRLWHRGFKGRFAYFRWNTHWSDLFDNVPGVGEAAEAYFANYNKSEYEAWLHGGPQLMAFMEQVPGTKNIAAHSMGNIVAGSALASGMTVSNYAMLQAAVAASCYDDRTIIQQTLPVSHTVSLDFWGHQVSVGSITVWDQATPDGDTDQTTLALSYRGMLKDIAQHCNPINFYLPNDNATSYAWEINNGVTKPPGEWANQFRYIPSNPSGQRLFKDYGNGVVDYTWSSRFESMAFAASSWGKAVGAESRTEGAIPAANRVDLGSPTFQLPTEPPNAGFGKQHSGEFNANIQHLKPFYDTLMDEFKLTPNP